MKLSEKQVLITGCYRSGTEYITLLLNNHPKLSANMYIVNFMRNCYDRYNPIGEEPHYSRLVFDAAQRIRSRFNKKLNAHKILDYCNEVDIVTYGFLYDIIMSELFLDGLKDCWAEKTQLVWTKIPDFLDILPNGKVIHIVRNPLNVLASFKKYTYAPEPAYLGAIFNCYDSMKKGIEYQKNQDPSRYLLLRYEDIITDPEKTVIKMFKFLDLSHEHNLLGEEGWKDAWGTPWTQNSVYASKNKPHENFDKSVTIDRWEKNLLPWEIALCGTVIGHLMDIYEYPIPNSDIDWKQMLKPVLKDPKTRDYFLRWLHHQEGVEEFPTDPLVEKNWEENSLKIPITDPP